MGWLILAVIIAAGLVVWLYLPLSRQLKTRADSVVDKRNELTELQNQVQNIGKQPGVTGLDQKQAELNRLLIPKSDILELLAAIEDQAHAAGVTETLALNEFPADAPAILKHPISLTVSGSYDGIVTFLRSLEGLDYYLNFDKISLTGGGAAAKTTGLNTATPPDDALASGTEPIQLTLAGFAYWR
jgi:Tfp pilus assembly protein PilO